MIPKLFPHDIFVRRTGKRLNRSSCRPLLARSFVIGTAATLAAAAILAAQHTAGEKTRVDARTGSENAPVATYSGKGSDYQVAPQKAKATVRKIDLEKRTVTVVPAKKGAKFKVAEIGPEGRTWFQVEEMECNFVMGAGLEKITASKGAAKVLGKKGILLDELPVGSEIKIEYYPALRSILEMTVERAGS
jgi:hypothetical protein